MEDKITVLDGIIDDWERQRVFSARRYEEIKDESVAEGLRQMDRRVGWGSNLYKVH